MTRGRRALEPERRPIAKLRAPDGRWWILYEVDLGPLEKAREELAPIDGEPPGELFDLSRSYDFDADGRPSRKLEVVTLRPEDLARDFDPARRGARAGIAALLARIIREARAAADPTAPPGHPARALALIADHLDRIAGRIAATDARDPADFHLALVAVECAARELGRLELLDPAASGHRVRRGASKGGRERPRKFDREAELAALRALVEAGRPVAEAARRVIREHRHDLKSGADRMRAAASLERLYRKRYRERRSQT